MHKLSFERVENNTEEAWRVAMDARHPDDYLCKTTVFMLFVSNF
jgi:hypothetical protein